MANETNDPAYQASHNLTPQGTSTPKKVCLLAGLSGTVLVNFPSAAKAFVWTWVHALRAVVRFVELDR